MTTFTNYPSLTTVNFTTNPFTQTYIYGNTVTGGLESPMILFAVFLVAFIAMNAEPVKQRVFTASLFFTLMIAFLMFGAGILSPFYLYGIMVLFGISLYLLMTINT